MMSMMMIVKCTGIIVGSAAQGLLRNQHEYVNAYIYIGKPELHKQTCGGKKAKPNKVCTLTQSSAKMFSGYNNYNNNNNINEEYKYFHYNSEP